MTREEAIRVLTENRPSLIFEDEEAQKRMADLCEAIDMAIEALKADKHGEWIKKVSPSGNTGWWKCSECGAVIFSESDIDKYYHHAYCGVCGAYMRGDSNEAPGK